MQGPGKLELTATEFTQLAEAASTRIAHFIDHIAAHPLDLTHEADPDFLRSLIEPVPESGADFDGLLDFIFNEGLRESLNPTSPGFLGYVPGGGL